MKKTKFILIALACFLGLVATAWGGTDVGQLTVTATVIGSCTVASTSAVDFAGYDVGDTNPTDTTGTITITCNPSLAYDIGLDYGANASGSQRRMVAGSNFLNYDLYQDNERTVDWGPIDTSDEKAVLGTESVGTVLHTVYGRMEAGQSIPQNVGFNTPFNDTVQVTVSW